MQQGLGMPAEEVPAGDELVYQAGDEKIPCRLFKIDHYVSTEVGIPRHVDQHSEVMSITIPR